MARLLGYHTDGYWLNDNNIEAQISYIKSNCGNSDHIRIMSSQFYTSFINNSKTLLKFSESDRKECKKHILSNWTQKIEESIFQKFKLWIYPINITNYHWIVATIEIEKKICNVYDSSSSDWEEQVRCAILYTYNMYLLKALTITERAYYQNIVDNIKTEIVINTVTVKKQRNGYDCGVFVLSHIDKILNSQECNTIDQKSVTQYRTNMVNFFSDLLDSKYK